MNVLSHRRSPYGRSPSTRLGPRPRLEVTIAVLVSAALWLVAPSNAQTLTTTLNITVVEDSPSLPPIADAQVTARRFGEGVQSAQTDPNGRVSFEVGRTFGLLLEATHPDYLPAARRLQFDEQGQGVFLPFDFDLLFKLERRLGIGRTTRELWPRSSTNPDVDVLRFLSGLLPPHEVRQLELELSGAGGETPNPRTPVYTAGRFSPDPFAKLDAKTFQKDLAPEPQLREVLRANPVLWGGVAGNGADAIVVGSGGSDPPAPGEPVFTVLSAGSAGGLAFLTSTFDATGVLLDTVVEPLGPDCTGIASDPVTTDRGEQPGAFAYFHECDLFVDLAPDGERNVPDFRPGGAGRVLDTLFGGWQTQAAAIPNGAASSSGTLVFSSRSQTPAELFDFTCRAGSSRIFFTEYSAAGERIVEHQLGDPIATQVGHGCFPDHTQQAAGVRYGDSFGVAYQVGEDLRLSTRALAGGAAPTTYSLGLQPSALDGIFFWQPAALGDRDSGGFLVDLPNGPNFEGSEDGEGLGFPPWPIVNSTLDLPLVPTGEALPHAVVSDASGRGWLVGTFDRAELSPTRWPRAPNEAVAELSAGGSDQVVAEVELPGCLDTDTNFCAHHNRFAVSARFATPQGEEGLAHARPLSNDSGTFWFFERDNRELIVKVLPACALNGRFWFFAAGLTDVEVQLEVWDRLTGVALLYFNPMGTSFQPILDTDAFECGANEQAQAMEAAVADLAAAGSSVTLLDPSSGPPSADGTACGGRAEDLCLSGGRFRVEVDFVGAGGALTPAFGGNLTDDTGALFFFDPANVEMLIKVLDACVFGSYWVFAAGLTDVGVEIRVTDTESGQTAVYRNPAGTPFQSIADTATFDSCS